MVKEKLFYPLHAFRAWLCGMCRLQPVWPLSGSFLLSHFWDHGYCYSYQGANRCLHTPIVAYRYFLTDTKIVVHLSVFTLDLFTMADWNISAKVLVAERGKGVPFCFNHHGLVIHKIIIISWAKWKPIKHLLLWIAAKKTFMVTFSSWNIIV